MMTKTTSTTRVLTIDLNLNFNFVLIPRGFGVLGFWGFGAEEMGVGCRCIGQGRRGQTR